MFCGREAKKAKIKREEKIAYRFSTSNTNLFGFWSPNLSVSFAVVFEESINGKVAFTVYD